MSTLLVLVFGDFGLSFAIGIDSIGLLVSWLLCRFFLSYCFWCFYQISNLRSGWRLSWFISGSSEQAVFVTSALQCVFYAIWYTFSSLSGRRQKASLWCANVCQDTADKIYSWENPFGLQYPEGFFQIFVEGGMQIFIKLERLNLHTHYGCALTSGFSSISSFFVEIILNHTRLDLTTLKTEIGLWKSSGICHKGMCAGF